MDAGQRTNIGLSTFFGSNDDSATSPFKYPLFCCCATPDGIITTCFAMFGCLSCAAAYADTIVEGDFCGACCANCMMDCCCICLWCCYRGVKRREHRARWGVKNDLMWIQIPGCCQQPCDIMLHLFCTCCALAQEANEFSARKIDTLKANRLSERASQAPTTSV